MFFYSYVIHIFCSTIFFKYLYKKTLLFKSYIYYFTLHYNMIYYNTRDENWLTITAAITLCVEILFFVYLTAEVFFQNYSIRYNS